MTYFTFLVPLEIFEWIVTAVELVGDVRQLPYVHVQTVPSLKIRIVFHRVRIVPSSRHRH